MRETLTITVLDTLSQGIAVKRVNLRRAQQGAGIQETVG